MHAIAAPILIVAEVVGKVVQQPGYSLTMREQETRVVRRPRTPPSSSSALPTAYCLVWNWSGHRGGNVIGGPHNQTSIEKRPFLALQALKRLQKWPEHINH